MIDFHIHPLYQSELRSQEEWNKVERVFTTDVGPPYGARPLEQLINRLDAARADYAVALPIDCRRARGTALLTIEEVKQLCSYTSRLIGFASVDPLSPHAVEDLEKAKDLGLCGLKLDPGLQGFDVASVMESPVWSIVEGWKWPVVMHVGFTFAPHVSMYASRVRDVEMLAERYPKANFVIAHWGFPWTMEACLLAIKLANVYIDTSALYFDNPKKFMSFVTGNQLSPSIIEKSLFDKIVFGSNYPRVSTHQMRKAIEALPLSPRCIQRILHDNAAQLLNSSLGG